MWCFDLVGICDIHENNISESFEPGSEKICLLCLGKIKLKPNCLATDVAKRLDILRYDLCHETSCYKPVHVM